MKYREKLLHRCKVNHHQNKSPPVLITNNNIKVIKKERKYLQNNIMLRYLNLNISPDRFAPKTDYFTDSRPVQFRKFSHYMKQT